MNSLMKIVTEWVRKHLKAEKVNSFSIVIILSYYYIGLLSYITAPIKPIYHLFTSGSTVAIVLRALTTALICIYCLLVVIVNQEKVKWKWLIIFIYILLFTLLSTSISPQTYNYMYISSTNYGTIYWVQASAGTRRLFTMYLSSISDFALAFCFLFILPVAIKNKKQLLLLTLPIVLIGIGECMYSVVRERSEYIKLFNMIDPQYKGYNINICASFGDKEVWGAFATVAFCSSIVSIFLVGKGNNKYLFLKILLILASSVLYIFSLLSLCKTAIGAQTICLFIVSIYLCFMFRKKNKISFFIYLSLITLFYTSVLLFFTIPALRFNSLLVKVYNVINTYVISPIFNGVSSGRTEIWTRLINNLRTYNLFFGLSKGGVSTYSQVITVEGQSMVHNGLVYFLASYGIVGFSVYIVLISIVFLRIIKLFRLDFDLSFVLLGLFFAALVFSLSEGEVLIVSGSNPIFVFNILLCVLPQGLIIKNIKRDTSEGKRLDRLCTQ